MNAWQPGMDMDMQRRGRTSENAGRMGRPCCTIWLSFKPIILRKTLMSATLQAGKFISDSLGGQCNGTTPL
jgi:hypothetical protein